LEEIFRKNVRKGILVEVVGIYTGQVLLVGYYLFGCLLQFFVAATHLEVFVVIFACGLLTSIICGLLTSIICGLLKSIICGLLTSIICGLVTSVMIWCLVTSVMIWRLVTLVDVAGLEIFKTGLVFPKEQADILNLDVPPLFLQLPNLLINPFELLLLPYLFIQLPLKRD
jgi:hypothetical protein